MHTVSPARRAFQWLGSAGVVRQKYGGLSPAASPTLLLRRCTPGMSGWWSQELPGCCPRPSPALEGRGGQACSRRGGDETGGEQTVSHTKQPRGTQPSLICPVGQIFFLHSARFICFCYFWFYSIMHIFIIPLHSLPRRDVFSS